jgi:hypothetical protein
MDNSPKSRGKNRRHAAVATNPVSRLDALDELEHFGANAEDRYAHVPERHPLGCPANSSGSGKNLTDIQLTDPVGGAMRAAKRDPHCAD